MSRFLSLVAIFLASLVPSVSVCGGEWDKERLRGIPQTLQGFVDEGKIAGAVTLVASDDQVIDVSVVGLADIASGRAMTRETIFRVASMTKPITATALMRLVEQGKLQFEDPVAKYIPTFGSPKLKDGSPKLKDGAAAREVTIAEVLTHTAGLASASGLQGERTLAEEVEAIGRQPLQFAPGTKWQYSSGLTVAGRLIEIASGMSYEDYLRKEIFEPLGMRDSGFTLTAEQAKRLATTYKPGGGDGKLAAVEIPDPTAKRMPNPSGGLYSTADDMAKFYQAVLRDLHGAKGLLDEGSTRRMLAPQTGDLITGFTPGNAWGLGWCLLRQPQGVTRLLSPGTFGHGGAWGTQGWVDPARGVVLVLMIQRSEFGNSDGSDVRDRFNESVLTSYRGVSSQTARFVPYLGYTDAVELRLDETRVVLVPQVGGRVIDYSVKGENMMFIDEKERAWKPGMPPHASAGRFDFGPELVVPKHPSLWSGPWTAEITGPHSLRLTSGRDESSGVQLIRDFTLRREGDENGSTMPAGAALVCTQTIMNIGDKTVEYCHWGRSFSPGGGICLVPLGDRPSRFPSKYVIYEDVGINAKNQDPMIRERAGFLEILGPPRLPKLGFDAYAGWLAYLMPINKLFVKRFETFPDRVYNEAAGLTISVWYPQKGGMIELEPIGPRERLEPGQVAKFTEHWSVFDFDYPRAGSEIDLGKLQTTVLGKKETTKGD
jgi:CubicO group peptidase (beta-lactamase class C family)